MTLTESTWVKNGRKHKRNNAEKKERRKNKTKNPFEKVKLIMEKIRCETFDWTRSLTEWINKSNGRQVRPQRGIRATAAAAQDEHTE